MTAADKAPDPGSVVPLRRRAVIVAIDAAGYSRQSEIDETTAIREITALSERIHASAASRGGRVFNTAGDGFMLEFPSAASGVAAAEEVQSVDRVPLRIGVHAGEVHETPKGDLLGKGVNIAARLMSLAQPGSIVVSADAKHDLPAAVIARLHSRGAVHLDKMNERIEAYDLGSPWKRPPVVPRRWVLLGAAAVAFGLVAWFGGQALLRPGSQAIAVLEFRASDPSLQTFATGLADRLIGAMSTNDLLATQTTAATEEDRLAAALSTGASFVLDGAVRPEGNDLLVTARLIDTRGRLAVWSDEYRRVADERNYMQEQIAVDVARVLRCALIGLRDDAGGVEPATLSLFLRACDKLASANSSLEETYLTARQVTERAPGFSRGWSMRARMAVWMAFSASGEEAQAFEAEARDAAARARRLDRRNGESYLAEVDLLPNEDLRGRQALIERALAADPDLAAAHAAQAYFYLEVGRASEALSSMRRAAALEPLNDEYWDMSPPLLSAVGGEDNQREANDLRERLYRVWPDREGAWDTRFKNALYVGDPAAALQMLDDIESSPVAMHPLAQERWRSFLLARQSGDQARLRRAALALRDLIPGKYSRTSVAAALSLAGDVDAAFDVTQAAMREGYGIPPVFMAPWANLRRDRRFMTFVKDSGLIQYWRETGRWPDFCRERDLPYNCEQEAARVLPP